MKLRALIAATLFASAASASFTANAQDTLTGDTRLACEAIMCLASPTRPGECASAIAKYFSISLKRFSSTLKARKNFLSLCPRVDPATIQRIVDSNPPEQDPPDNPVPLPPVSPLTPAQILARIAKLVPVWEAQVANSAAARAALEQCVQRDGRVQDGFCGPELADYEVKLQLSVATRDEIDRLQELLDSLECSRKSNVKCLER
ncbi:TrbM/KikA/MpfK family conjugal transfer protein [Massilia glaciei]|uniref:Conjugal transfer protein TrbM n=1 Tax=Massilia glaciei TaxID=1524097 RepID=A0A2U2I6I3_9BURK|nr:TrbM/KikA/MpfK family conjugal transfer protein [Massilia glaciei]PWF55360.1 hypothetical protein C7C56_002205 [Massilia glaciei]